MSWAVHVVTAGELKQQMPRGRGGAPAWLELLTGQERRAYSAEDGGCLVVARDGATVGGWAGFVRIAPKGCEISQFVVQGEHRGKGLGTRLMQGLLNEVRRMGYARVVSRIEPWCPEWRAFYKGHGFVFVNEEDEEQEARQKGQGAAMELVME